MMSVGRGRGRLAVGLVCCWSAGSVIGPGTCFTYRTGWLSLDAHILVGSRRGHGGADRTCYLLEAAARYLIFKIPCVDDGQGTLGATERGF